MIWAAVLAGCLGCYLLKLAGWSVPARWLEQPTLQRAAVLLPVPQPYDQPVFTRARFVVDDGVPGMRQTFDNPLPTQGANLRALPAPRTDAQKIADTLEAETQ